MNSNNENDQIPRPRGFSTKAVHASQDPEQWESLCLVPPTIVSTTFKHTDGIKNVSYFFNSLKKLLI